MGHKLLLADDSVTIQRVIELTFADEDVQVIAVGNGQQAIEHAERDRPDIVLADVGMPERDGYEVAAFIKGHPTLSQVPVILLTGAFEPIDETRARAVGCDGVLVKPFEPQMVISRVKDLLAGKRPAGLWGSGPAAQGPVRPASPVPDLRAPAAPSGGADPLEAYFDRLDAAFSSIGSGTPPELTPAPRASAPAAPAPAAPAQEIRPVPPAAEPRRQPIPLSKPAAAPADDLASWDPDLEGSPVRPAEPPPAAAPTPAPAPLAAAPAQTPPAAAPRAASPDPFEQFFGAPMPVAAPAPPPAAVAAPAPAAPMAAAPPRTSAEGPADGPASPPPSLVDAFAALLAAEQRMSIAPSAAPLAGSRVSDDVIEDITRRVLDRLADHTVRPTVLDVAERLVREEIDRIKQQAH
jgi:CheY-like chemotaxis protein